MSIPTQDTVDESPANRNNSCFRTAICSLVKPKSSHETRQRYQERASKEAAQTVSRAETAAFDQEHEDALTTIEFRIQHHVAFGEELCLVGSVRALGDWNAAEQAVPMRWSSGDQWTASVTVRRWEVPKLEYKYIVKSPEGIAWEQGGNHNVLKPAQRAMVQTDFWEFPGYNCRV